MFNIRIYKMVQYSSELNNFTSFKIHMLVFVSDKLNSAELSSFYYIKLKRWIYIQICFIYYFNNAFLEHENVNIKQMLLRRTRIITFEFYYIVTVCE